MARIIRIFPSILLGLFAVSAAACAVGVEDEGPGPIVHVEDTSAPDAPAAGGMDANASATSSGDPVYFGQTNYLEEGRDTGVADAAAYTFELVADSYVQLRLSRVSPEGPSYIGFTLFRVTGDGALNDLGSANGHDGVAAMKLYTVHGGTYAIQLREGLKSDALALDLSCLSGACAPRRQPGENCAATGTQQCDVGLVCRFADGECKAPEQPGRCEIPPADCKSEYSPVCGCDGETWGNECFARQAGISILHTGDCKQ